MDVVAQIEIVAWYKEYKASPIYDNHNEDVIHRKISEIETRIGQISEEE